MSPSNEFDKYVMGLFLESLIEVICLHEYLDYADPKDFEYWVTFGDQYDLCLKALRSGPIVGTAYRVNNGICAYRPIDIAFVWSFDSSSPSETR